MTWNEEPNLTEEQKQKALEHVKKPWKFTYPPTKIALPPITFHEEDSKEPKKESQDEI